ncbi:4-amino-4-deoxy-L-arabinose transferase-like glycosyltransferase [Silvibacterium bohemicum]|uniref:4-amino-4-deoxy-L-arabinose transferase-like glycosyltransferase n=1 Tax=Silvibacterium bohemicum TaxID=1577686 RepID=A0A841K5Q6_9BACT|nr:glycosyltransferase family 39 protein [Silvibacterium bohemicum]MBB6146471.1 4-amino-4-deoxy-L-arabinose transferase-like glycosyltransferase [Silvibacterium bohemicum]
MNSLRTAKRFWLPLLGLWFLLYASFSLLKPPLLDGVDSVQAEAAREMATAGDWITPHLDGVRYLSVSPLLTWATALSFKLFGVTDWAARLPLAFAALALFIVTLALGARMFLTPVAGFYSALILITSSGIFLFSHLLYPQVVLTLWVTAALYFFWRSTRAPSLGTALGFALCCALGTLTQGPAGVILPLATVVLFLFFTRNLSHLLRWHPVIATAVFLAIALPWRLAVHSANPRRPYFSALPRVWNTPLLLFWAFLLLFLLPWSFFSIAALTRIPRLLFTRPVAAAGAKLDCKQQAQILLVLWLVVTTLFFSFWNRHEFSALPALPALAILAAGWLAEDEASPSPLGRIFAWIFAVLGIATAFAAVVLALHAPFPGFAVDIATLLHLHSGHRLFFGYLRDLTLASMGAFRIPLLVAAAALAAGVVANLVFRLRGHARLANCFLAGMMAFLLIAAHIALNTFSPVFSSAILAEAIKPEVGAGDAVVIQGRYEDASALGFYLEKRILILNTPAGDLAPGSSASDAPPVFVDLNDLAKLWNGPGRVFLWTTPDAAPQLPAQSYLIGRDGGHQIVSNEPNNGGAAF